jgi:hypothetical protein
MTLNCKISSNISTQTLDINKKITLKTDANYINILNELLIFKDFYLIFMPTIYWRQKQRILIDEKIGVKLIFKIP